MDSDPPPSTRRFSNRVDDYVRHRPRYPSAVAETIATVAGLTPGSVVADVGSGTGISTELLLRGPYTVYAVEPNSAMRAEAERSLGGWPRFRSVAGTAEATTLPEVSVDLVAAGQAFHWFDAAAARREFLRILRGRGWSALFWNTRLLDATPFLRDYEALLVEYGTDYREVNHVNLPAERFRSFFGGEFRSYHFPNEQVFDFEGLRGRLLSSSYAPAAGHPRHVPMLRRLREIFGEHQVDGRVRLLYDTELHIGALRG